jgi:hypothetical protein
VEKMSLIQKGILATIFYFNIYVEAIDQDVPEAGFEHDF